MSQKSALDSFLENFQVLQDISDRLTVKRIFTVLVVGLMCTFIAILYENRASVFQMSYQYVTGDSEPKPGWSISNDTKVQLTNFVKQVDLVNMISIIEVDLRRNTRFPRFFFVEDIENSRVIQDELSTLLPQAVFDMDPKNTKQLVSVLQNEFSCVRFQDTVYQRFVPEVGKKTPVICRIAIPPFYNKFAGYITIGLSQAPTRYEVDSLRIEASRLAVEIYLRDVMKKPIPK
jgi:hypothetical protein